MSTFYEKWSILSTAMLVASCANVQSSSVQDRVSGPTASIQFVNQSAGQNIFFVYQGSERCTDARTSGNVLPGDEQSVLVPAGQPVSVASNVVALNLPTVTSCRVIMTFTPMQGAKYRALMFTDSQQCRVSVETASTTSSGVETYTPVDARQRTPKTPFFASQGFCEP
jgi:hypothetical protein